MMMSDRRATEDGDLEDMAAVSRLFEEWFKEDWGEDLADASAFDKTDLGEAFAAGWEACYHARWEKVGGLPLGESLKGPSE